MTTGRVVTPRLSTLRCIDGAQKLKFTISGHVDRPGAQVYEAVRTDHFSARTIEDVLPTASGFVDEYPTGASPS